MDSSGKQPEKGVSIKPGEEPTVEECEEWCMSQSTALGCEYKLTPGAVFCRAHAYPLSKKTTLTRGRCSRIIPGGVFVLKKQEKSLQNKSKFKLAYKDINNYFIFSLLI